MVIRSFPSPSLTSGVWNRTDMVVAHDVGLRLGTFNMVGRFWECV